MKEIRKLIQTIQAYRIRAETTGHNVGPDGGFTTDYKTSGPFMWNLQRIVRNGFGNEIEKWNSLVPGPTTTGRINGTGPGNLKKV